MYAARRRAARDPEVKRGKERCAARVARHQAIPLLSHPEQPGREQHRRQKAPAPDLAAVCAPTLIVDVRGSRRCSQPVRSAEEVHAAYPSRDLGKPRAGAWGFVPSRRHLRGKRIDVATLSRPVLSLRRLTRRRRRARARDGAPSEQRHRWVPRVAQRHTARIPRARARLCPGSRADGGRRRGGLRRRPAIEWPADAVRGQAACSRAHTAAASQGSRAARPHRRSSWNGCATCDDVIAFRPPHFAEYMFEREKALIFHRAEGGSAAPRRQHHRPTHARRAAVGASAPRGSLSARHRHHSSKARRYASWNRRLRLLLELRDHPRIRVGRLPRRRAQLVQHVPRRRARVRLLRVDDARHDHSRCRRGGRRGQRCRCPWRGAANARVDVGVERELARARARRRASAPSRGRRRRRRRACRRRDAEVGVGVVAPRARLRSCCRRGRRSRGRSGRRRLTGTRTRSASRTSRAVVGRAAGARGRRECGQLEWRVARAELLR